MENIRPQKPTHGPWMKLSNRTTHAREKRTHPSLTGKLEAYQLYRAQFPPTATARDRDLTAGGPLSTDIGHRPGAPAESLARRRRRGGTARAHVANVSGLRGCARGVLPAAASAAVLEGGFCVAFD